MTVQARSRRNRNRRTPELVMTLPAVILFAGMFVLPTFLAIYLSLTDWNGYSNNPSFIGLSNYTHLFDNPRIGAAAVFTGGIAVLGTVLCNALGLGVAVLISEPTRINAVLRTLLFYPYILSTLIIGFLWSTLLSGNGVINSFLSQVGLDALPFLADPQWAKASVLVVVVWSTFGLNLILYLAGLQSVPKEYYEAATLDGASAWQQFRHITFPMIASVVTVNLVVVMVALLKTYELVLALPGGGPAGKTQTVVYQVLFESFQNSKLGFGSAQAVLLMLVTATLGLGISVLRRKSEQKVAE